ncbi:UDP-glucuronosyltransferase 2C1 [Strongylocentrotus purpuratus]|uniref:Uncharacterized protein n=1 Tax=Strongylocentrotus purpuratus TaxID=7668 RepID=A0A7M7P3C7_STRPU|nr:UDP-glucuronosyltransferase 2C1 [Strongylocentrotus purpuratus]
MGFSNAFNCISLNAKCLFGYNLIEIMGNTVTLFLNVRKTFVTSFVTLRTALFNTPRHLIHVHVYVVAWITLVRQGHNVTCLIMDEYKERADDPELKKYFNFEIYRNTDPHYTTKEYFQFVSDLAFNDEGGLRSFGKMMYLSKELLRKSCLFVLEDKEMMKRLEKMDAMVSDVSWLCSSVIKLYLKKHANSDIRIILNVPNTPNAMILDLAGSPVNPAYQPSTMSGLTSNMTFIERTINTISTAVFRSFGNQMGSYFLSFAEQFDLEDEIMAMGPPAADLFLGNFDFAVEFPFPITPNVIPVGGVTAEAPNDLPQELEDFIQSSGDDGIVVFTLSTYFASVTTSRPHLLKMFIDALAKLPQKVIIQLKVMPQYDLPPNIKALPWLPQNDLLGHPKTRLFMYHGGNNGFYEAVYHGVPIVVVPFIADQFDTAVKVTSHGMGLQLDKRTLSADYIHKHVAEVLGDEKYSLAAKRLSTILRSRPMEPVDRAAFWIEHVIKHGGDYMRSPGKDLSFIQYNLIDVFMFLIGIGALLLFVFYKIVRCCISCCWGKKISHKSKSD